MNKQNDVVPAEQIAENANCLAGYLFEPSDDERSQWPDSTREYVEGLEQLIDTPHLQAAPSGDVVERIAVDLSDRLISRMDIDEDDPRLSMIIDELREKLTTLTTPPSNQEAALLRDVHKWMSAGPYNSVGAQELLSRIEAHLKATEQ